MFVSAEVYLGGDGPAGGVQICTREYQDTLAAAGYDLRVVTYQPDRRPLARVRRRLDRRPYAHLLPPGLADRVAGAAAGAAAVFLNQVDLTPIAGGVRRRLPPGCPLVLLSHGLESVDHLHLFRSRVVGAPFAGLTRRDERNLGRMLVDECRAREHLDLVLCLAPFEAEVERWIGSRRVEWLPRTVPADPLPWAPVPGRVGFVGTLNHPPNREGLELLLAALARRADAGPVRVRLVGGPPSAATDLVRRYPFVDYLGPLPDADLRQEAGTWAAFAHPLFCFSRGCSTKLAVGLGWELPVLTTPAGARGYEWRGGSLPTADTPDELAGLCVQTLDPVACRTMRERARVVARSSPALAEVAAKVAAALAAVDLTRAPDRPRLPNTLACASS